MSFYPDEVRRIEDAELILLGVQPSELERMSLQQRADVLEIKRARANVEAARWRRK